MAITADVSRKLDNNYVQVDITSTKIGVKHFKVPKNKVDSFCSNYKKNEKKMSMYSTLLMVGSAIAGASLGYICTKNMNKTVRTIAEIVASVGGVFASIYGMANVMEKSSDNLLKKHGAEELTQHNPTVSDIIAKA
jgi:hypothetical protein